MLWIIGGNRNWRMLKRSCRYVVSIGGADWTKLTETTSTLMDVLSQNELNGTHLERDKWGQWKFSSLDSAVDVHPHRMQRFKGKRKQNYKTQATDLGLFSTTGGGQKGAVASTPERVVKGCRYIPNTRNLITTNKKALCLHMMCIWHFERAWGFISFHFSRISSPALRAFPTWTRLMHICNISNVIIVWLEEEKVKIKWGQGRIRRCRGQSVPELTRRSCKVWGPFGNMEKKCFNPQLCLAEKLITTAACHWPLPDDADR